MWDYYRARFKVLNPKRRPITKGFVGTGASRMPDATRRICWLAWLLSGALLAVGTPESFLQDGFLGRFVAAHLVLTPVSFTLGAGFSERQAWSRPLLLGLVVFCVCAVALSGHHLLAAVAALGALATGLHLYGSPAARRYFAELRAEKLLGLEARDLGNVALIPLYGAWAGIALGIVAGWLVVSRHLASHPAPGAMGPNDALALVLGGFVGALLFGLLGRLVGEAFASRSSRP